MLKEAQTRRAAMQKKSPVGRDVGAGKRLCRLSFHRLLQPLARLMQ
jgi:hypothetical protein